ncbi:MBL fold metallo-hydrolase [Butyrivibrio sp. YAB3001]|uniref:MBL fold metallo-hydrolase n=1 Tax=Butyrivibrio sp. YAB3001 TaxID=1520812 RepID=UPI0008F61F09|nr:MBL fold metallo-hydrolase [Butyrivibrio sp. YAB3001]SFB66627.1 Glyoxylase, beta-lactamase superfamily II [Butyrivibrio sp. YAB3001]
MAAKNIQVASMTLGMCGTNCYFVFDQDAQDEQGMRHGILFDPADRGERIFETLKDKNLIIDLILLTHGHFDHIGGAEALRKLSGAQIGCYEKEIGLCNDPYLNLSNDFGGKLIIVPDITYKDESIISAAGLSCKLLATPGHTSGSCCYLFEDEQILISGDTLFEESVGRTDFPTSSTSELIRSINDRIFILPDETVVYPGHGEMTTVGHEKMYNPFCRM